MLVITDTGIVLSEGFEHRMEDFFENFGKRAKNANRAVATSIIIRGIILFPENQELGHPPYGKTPE